MREANEELLALLRSVSDVMFPGDDQRQVTLDSHGYDGDTPLHVFLWQGNDAAAKVLVAAGADVNAIGEMGETPLHVAARTAESETIAAIIAVGGKVDVISEFGQTPPELARERGRQEVWRRALLVLGRLRERDDA